ncbi:transcriptional regulator [Acidovorax sp. CF316]|uniref:MarR family winged helix-turn-helix transcriptional regulator n=1 Tax=Acidovorax sp. CF316 TaxID=1144317 RepID=UPI00026BCAA4|nr:MarR family transcriptional regulator [Acidovorax sp. CF316]EJE54032.1 transcriptional regulator [Acidovorax sp. CF316]
MPAPSAPPDAVDAILAQWHRERPDLDVSPMGPIGRIKRCAALLQRRLDETFEEFGLSFWEFDMLATLRRSGAPYCLAPTTLFSTLMVTSGTMTHRMNKLEASGFVARLPNPEDARSMLVQLTPAGLALIDRAVQAHVANEHRILAPLKAADLAVLDAKLAVLLAALEAPPAPQARHGAVR